MRTRWWIPCSLRWRLLLWHGLLLALVLCGFGLTLFEMEGRKLLQRVDESLAAPLSEMHRALARSGRGPESPGNPRPPPRTFNVGAGLEEAFAAAGVYYVAWSRLGQRIGASENAPAGVAQPDPAAGPSLVPSHRSAGERREAFLFTPPGECLLVGRWITAERKAHHAEGWIWLGLGTGILLAAMGVDAWLLGRALRPMETISTAAEEIASGRLRERISGHGAVTEMAGLIAVLNRSFGQLEELVASQRRFTSDAAHELRTPLTVLLTELELARTRERSAEAYRETLRVCSRAARRMEGLIDSLLTLARLDEGAAELTKERCDLRAIAMEAVDALRPVADQAGIKVEVSGEAAFCAGDARLLSQIAANLIGNAVRHNEAGGWVRASTGGDAKGVWLTVADNGPGITAEDLPRVFERFYRADASRSRHRGGAGLGLAISQRLALLYEGEIRVESRPGEGCTFTLRLPEFG
jgi:two-component system OmpR family sensor kinase